MKIKSDNNSAIVVSKSVGIVLMIFYALQLGALVWLVWLYGQQQMVINEQKKRIEDLENKLMILDIIDRYQIGFNDEEMARLAGMIYDTSGELGIDPILVLAVILTESSFKDNQVSRMGAVGLMQVMPSVGREVAERWSITWPSDDALHDPLINVKIGTTYLFELIMKFRDVRDAIIAYNIGEGVIREYQLFGAAPPDQYYQRVKRNYLDLRSYLEDSR